MRKGQTLYRNSPIQFFPESIILPIEEWRDITEAIVPEVVPYYMISNYGRVFHKYKGTILMNNTDSKGYLYKPLSTKSGKPKNCRIHRLVMMAFNYFPGCEDTLINHKDGVKTNCFIWNLEWSTYSENAKHAFNNGLANKFPVYTEEQIRTVCKYLEEPSNTLIYISTITGLPYTLIQSVQNRRTHVDISSQYNIKPRKINSNFSIEQVHELCKYFASNKKTSKDNSYEYFYTALKLIGIENPTSLEIKSANKIYTKETYSYISNEYF